MNLDLLTREELLRYFADEISLTELRARLRPIAWKLGDAEMRATSPLTRRVALYVAEFNRGHRTEDELRRLLAEAAETVYVVATDSLYEVLRYSLAETIPAEPAAEARTQPVEGFETEASQSPRTRRRTTKAPPDLMRTG